MFEDIKPGRIKGSVNIPIALLIDPNTKQMKCVDAIREVFKDASIDLDNTPIVATCACGEFSALFVRVDSLGVITTSPLVINKDSSIQFLCTYSEGVGFF